MEKYNIFVDVKFDYVDDNGVMFIDGFKTHDENEEGLGIGYFIFGTVYWRNPEYQYDSLVKKVVAELKENHKQLKKIGEYITYNGKGVRLGGEYDFDLLHEFLSENNPDGYFVLLEDKEMWFKNGVLNRDNDLPTVIQGNSQFWHKNGLLHRDNDKPAMISNDGSKYWFKNGELHREDDKPAMIYANGEEYWYKNGKLIK